MAAFLGCVLAGATELNEHDDSQTSRILQSNAKLKSRIRASQRAYQTLGGETRSLWKPEDERIEKVIVKNARGHAFFEFGEPLFDSPAHVSAAPFEALTSEERAEFEDVDMGAFWPEVGSRMLTRLVTGHDLYGSWVVVQNGVYRYAVSQSDGILVRSVLYEYLATEVCWTR